jgi:rod shape-determining protein MreD
MTAFRRAVAIPVALLLALLLQLTIVNRAPLPGNAAPDLVLLVVTATGATTGPLAGLLAGFFGGLALDVAPPGGHLAGEYALVFCLAGFACGRLRAVVDAREEHASITSLTVMAIGAAGGEAAKVALGMMLSDPEVTGPAVKHVLPGAILYDLLLCPFVLWLMAAVLRRRAVAGAPDLHRRPGTARYGAIRLAGAGAAPRLRFGGARPVMTTAPRRKEPKLRLAGAGSSLSARTRPGASPSSLPLPGRRPVTVNFTARGGGLTGGGAPRSGLFSGHGRPSAPGKGWLRAEKPRVNGMQRKSPAKGWLRSSGLPRAGQPAMASWQRRSPGKGWLKTSKPSPSWRRKSPPKGWLRSGRGRRMGGMR